MAEDFTEQLREALGGAASDALRGNEEMVTKWLALVEVMDADGGRSLYCVTNPDAKTWDVLGMLSYGVERSQALAVRDEVGGEWG